MPEKSKVTGTFRPELCGLCKKQYDGPGCRRSKCFPIVRKAVSALGNLIEQIDNLKHRQEEIIREGQQAELLRVQEAKPCDVSSECDPECGGRPSDGPPCRNCGKPVRHIYDDYYGCGCQGGGVKEGKKTNALWLYLDKWYDVTDGYDNLPPEWRAIVLEEEKEDTPCTDELTVWKRLDEKIRKEADKIESKYRTYHGWEIVDDKVIIDWTESWSYGGHDEGSEDIPLSKVLESPVKKPAPKSTKKWYLFHKSFQGGTHDEWRLLDHKPKDEDMENWGENTGGGHNYGYRVTVKKGTPPREVIVKKIEEVRKHIERINKSRELEDCQEEIAELEQFLGPEGAK